MFICCKNQLKIIEKNINNIDNINCNPVCCICSICNKKYLCKLVCDKCYESLNKNDFNRCEKFFSEPIRSILNNKNIEHNIKLIREKYNMYSNFENFILKYIISYKNFYDIFTKIYIMNGKDIKKTKQCFLPFFCFGILYILNDKKKFICEECIYR